MRKPETIERLYLDFDGFFASVHQQITPKLRGKPIGVIPFETNAASSTVVIACSREAKAAGCKNVMRVRDALDRCPELILVTQRPDWYRRAHNALINEIECEIPIETIKSIDELACILGKADIADPDDLASRLKKRIAKNIGPYITCSIGFAANRLLAKIACKVDKPNGVTIWRPDDMPGPLFKRPMSDIPGIGSKISFRLMVAGITTIEDLYATQPKHLRALWGNVNGERMWYAIHGYEIFAQPTSRGMFGHGRVLPPGHRDIERAKEYSRLLLSKAARRMRRDAFFAKSLWLWLNMRSGVWYKQLELPSVQDEPACLAALNKLWSLAKKELAGRPVEIIRVGVTLSELGEPGVRQLDMFLADDDQRQQAEVLTNTVDRLNAKFGKRVVTFGHWSPPPGGYAGGKIAFNRIPSAEDFW